MDQLLEKASHGEAIHFSELLRDIPSDEILANLFFDPEHPENNGVSQFGLEMLKLRLEGYKLSEIADRLRPCGQKAGPGRGKNVHIRGTDASSQSIHRIRISSEQDDPGVGIPISRGVAWLVSGISEKWRSAPGFHPGAFAYTGAKGEGGGPLLCQWVQLYENL